VWVTFLARRNLFDDKTLCSFVILSGSEESGLQGELVFHTRLVHSLLSQMLRFIQHDTIELPCRKIWPHPNWLNLIRGLVSVGRLVYITASMG